jgi:hypothetical protein
MTPAEALDIIRQKVQLPKGVSARIDPKAKNSVTVGTIDLVFVLTGEALAYDEDYLLHKTKNGIASLVKVLPEYEQQKADAAKAEALVKEQKSKRKK